MITENLSTLTIHKLTQEQYDRALMNGNIDPNALYLTPDEEIDLSPYAIAEQVDEKFETLVGDTPVSTQISNSAAELQAEIDKKFPTSGGTLTGIVTLTNGSLVQSAEPHLKWKKVGDNVPYLGFAQDQVDGTFLWSLRGVDYRDGLAIGGGTGNLLWKGVKVATADDLAGKSNTNHTHSELQSKINALTEQVEKLTARIAVLESWHAMSGIGDVNGDGHITELDAQLIDKYVAGDLELTDEEYVRADVNGDLVVNGTDSALIRKYLKGQNTGNPLEDFEIRWTYAGESGYGDINNDGYITTTDAMMVAKQVVNDITLTAEQRRRADVNGDGDITVLDGMMIGQRILGDIDKFPVEE